MPVPKQTTKNSQRKITVIFGYSLFVVALLTVIVSIIIPWSAILMNPDAKHLNVIIILLSFISAAIVPFIVSYIIGDKTTRTRNRVTHHYNGILFGVVAYWLSIFFSSIGALAPIMRTIPGIWMVAAVNAWPILATIFVITIIAINYHARPQKTGQSVLRYKPYQILLISSVIATLILTQQYSAEGYQAIGVLLNIVVPTVFIAISYLMFKKAYTSRPARLSSAIVAFSFGFTAMSFSAQIGSVAGYTVLTTLMATIIGLATWIIYLRLIVKISKSNL